MPLFELPLSFCVSLFRDWLCVVSFVKLKLSIAKKVQTNIALQNLLSDVEKAESFVIQYYWSENYRCCESNFGKSDKKAAFNWLKESNIKCDIYYLHNGSLLLCGDQNKHLKTIHLEWTGVDKWRQPTVPVLSSFLNSCPLVDDLAIINYDSLCIECMSAELLRRLKRLIMSNEDGTVFVCGTFMQSMAENCRHIHELTIVYDIDNNYDVALRQDSINAPHLMLLLDQNDIRELQLTYNGIIYNHCILETMLQPKRQQHIISVILHLTAHTMETGELRQWVSLITECKNLTLFVVHVSSSTAEHENLVHCRYYTNSVSKYIRLGYGSIQVELADEICVQLTRLFLSSSEYHEISLINVKVNENVLGAIAPTNTKMRVFQCEFDEYLPTERMEVVGQHLKMIYENNRKVVGRRMLVNYNDYEC